jgi:CDGSH-type Zn-finger protein
MPEAGGPIRLEGPFTLVAADGRTHVTGTRAALCRCGRSGNKPFCDGSHART